MLRLGDPDVTLIIMSVGIYLSNFASDKTVCPVCMANNNLSLKIRQIPRMRRIVIVALLPIPLMNPKFRQMQQDEPRQIPREVVKNCTADGTPATHHYTQSQSRERVLQHALSRWQLQVLQTGYSSMASR
jgi:hypothetical protein